MFSFKSKNSFSIIVYGTEVKTLWMCQISEICRHTGAQIKYVLKKPDFPKRIIEKDRISLSLYISWQTNCRSLKGYFFCQMALFCMLDPISRHIFKPSHYNILFRPFLEQKTAVLHLKKKKLLSHFKKLVLHFKNPVSYIKKLVSH